MRYLFDVFSSYLRQLMNHRIPLTADDLPMFLYDLDLFKATNMWRGLLRGRLLIVVSHSNPLIVFY